MSVSQVKVNVRIRLRWWLRPYLWTLVAFCVLTKQLPDEEKLAYWITKGLKTDVFTR